MRALPQTASAEPHARLVERVRQHARAAGRGAVAVELARAVRREAGAATFLGSGVELLHERPEAAAELYEALLASEGSTRKRLGAWYTPEPLARWTAAHALADLAPRSDTKVVDPAAGCGAFLRAAAHGLLRRFGVDTRRRRTEVAKMLWGIDRDPHALAIAEAVLHAEGFPIPAGQLVAADALLEGWPVEEVDAVVGNPPYVNIVRLPPPQRAALREAYRTFRNKCDLYGLFIEAAANRLRTGGRLAFVVSDSFLGADSFVALRRALLGGEGMVCERISRVEGRVFGAAVSPVVVVARRGPMQDGDEVRFGRVDARGTVRDEWSVSARKLAARAHQSLAIPDSPADLERAEQMVRAGVPLAELVEMSLGIKTGDDGRFVRGERAETHRVRGVRGRQVSRYRVEGSVWIDYRPEVLRGVHGARPRKRESFDRPAKLLVRETSGRRLIAAHDAERRFPLDTVHALFHPDTQPPRCSLWYLLGVLDSAPTGWWYGTHHPGPHVKLAELRTLPVPAPESGPPDCVVAALADAAVFLAGRNPVAEVPQAVLEPGARHAVVDVLARRLSTGLSETDGPAAEALLDAVVAAGYGVEG